MGRRLERWRWRQLALLTSSRGVCGRLRTPANLAGGVRDAGQESRVHDAPGQLGRSLRPLGNLQRRVLTLPRPRKRSAACFRAFRGLGNVQTTCFIISDPSETFKQPVSSFPSPRKPSNNLFHHFRPLENLQTTCFIISDPSKTFKQPVSSFPTPRGVYGRRRSLLGTGF